MSSSIYEKDRALFESLLTVSALLGDLHDCSRPLDRYKFPIEHQIKKLQSDYQMMLQAREMMRQILKEEAEKQT